jgi:molecular chaperone GrpE
MAEEAENTEVGPAEEVVDQEPRPAGDPAAPGREAEEAAGIVADDLEEILSDLKRERDEYLELAQRAKADFENYRKRALRDAEDAERRGKAGLANAVVPAVDNLERALLAAGVSTEPAEPDADPASREVSAHEALAEGVALIYRELAGALASAGIESFDPKGEEFDPATSEALSTRPATEGEGKGVVAETLQRGYRIGETLIRPARVVVTE